MQTCAHISGAAYYYNPQKCKNLKEIANKKLMGCCIHKDYGI